MSDLLFGILSTIAVQVVVVNNPPTPAAIPFSQMETVSAVTVEDKINTSKSDKTTTKQIVGDKSENQK